MTRDFYPARGFAKIAARIRTTVSGLKPGRRTAALAAGGLAWALACALPCAAQAAAAADASGTATTASGDTTTSTTVTSSVPPSNPADSLPAPVQNEITAQEAELVSSQNANPNMSPKAEAVADIQTVQNLNRNTALVPAGLSDRFLPAASGTIQVGGFMPSASVAAEGTPNVQAAASTAAAPVVAGAVAPVLVSTEGQPAGRAAAAGISQEQTVVGTLVSVDVPRSELTIRDHFSGEAVTLVAAPAELRDLERGIEVRAVIEAGTNRATRIDTQTSR